MDASEVRIETLMDWGVAGINAAACNANGCADEAAGHRARIGQATA